MDESTTNSSAPPRMLTLTANNYHISTTAQTSEPRKDRPTVIFVNTQQVSHDPLFKIKLLN